MADKQLLPKPKGKGKGGKRHLLLYGSLAVLAAGGIWLYTQSKKKKPPGTQTATPTTQATGGAYSTSPAVGTLASQVPQFVNQTYVNPTPPQVTQTTNITNKPPAPPPPPHRGDDDDEDRRRKINRGGGPPPSGWKGPHPGPHPHTFVPSPGPHVHPPIQPRPPTQHGKQPKVAF